ncbi:Uma2 family endonuclease [Tundrisphaera lichenicola]|uniref:Uma2 family endonuclease n=1 Tax=Tundrisphaera lichenicola TaxID=2029860 RepID=UPI003EB77209
MSQATMIRPDPARDIAPGEEPLYEIVQGQKVEKPPMGTYQILVGSILLGHLYPYARMNGLGRVVSEMLFKINKAGDPLRRPDVAFVSYDRWPRDRKVDSENGWDVVPDLFIEVVSRSNSAGEVIGKVLEYFKAGARRVWVVYPIERQVYVYESARQTRILGIGEALDGEDLLPGFRLELAELFADGPEIPGQVV